MPYSSFVYVSQISSRTFEHLKLRRIYQLITKTILHVENNKTYCLVNSNIEASIPFIMVDLTQASLYTALKCRP